MLFRSEFATSFHTGVQLARRYVCTSLSFAIISDCVIDLYIQSEKKLFHGPISNPCYYFPYYYGKLAQLSSLRGRSLGARIPNGRNARSISRYRFIFYSNMECRLKRYLTPNLGWASVFTLRTHDTR